MLKRILVLSAAAGATGWLAAPPAARLARGARPILASARPLCRPFAADAATAGRCAAPRLMADAAVVPAPAEEPDPNAGKILRKKLLPLGAMFFFILFNYTILRDTKDVLVVTAPGSGAEIIPFLKTYVNLPGAIAFTALYAKLTNKFSRQQVFNGVVGTFLVFFALFATVIYPNAAMLHPTAWCQWLAALLPAGFAAPIAIIQNWTYAVFYTMAELWGSVVASLLFWGFANELTSVPEAKKYYPLFGLGANVALVFSGQFVRYVSGLRRTWAAAGCTFDPWGASLKYLMGGVVVSGSAVLGINHYLTTRVLTDPDCVDQTAQKKAKVKTKMGLKESAQFLASSKYIRLLATLVICYGMAINIVEVTWKSRLKMAFPNPNDYSEFMGTFSSATGAVTLTMMLISQRIFKVFGWGIAALVTPTMIALTGGIFFGLILFNEALLPLIAALGTTPLMLAVVVGAAQNVLSKSAKYSLFDPCKEMAYIPLDAESKTKGKAAIDVIGNPLGKSGGSLIQQALIFGLGSLAVATPYLAAILAVIVAVWIRSARALNLQFIDAMEAAGEEA